MSQEPAFVLKILMKEEGGTWYARCEEMPGLHVCADSIESTCLRVMKAIKALFKHAHNVDVSVAPAFGYSGSSRPETMRPCDQFVVQQAAA